jgi:hypothetical protein
MTTPEPKLLTGLFIAHLKARLVDEAISAIRPAIQDAVADVVLEMGPTVQAYVDHLKNQMLVQITTKEIPAK